MGMLADTLRDISTAFYRGLIPALIFAVLAIAVYHYTKRLGFKNVVREWLAEIKNSHEIRMKFIFLMYAYFVIDYTLLSRTFIYSAPWNEIMGGWWIEKLPTGVVVYEAIENIVFFIPYTFLLLCSFPEFIQNRSPLKKLWRVLMFAFLTSVVIESGQFLTKVGTLQVSDLVYNTLGGFIGYLLYMLKCAIGKNKK